MYNDDKKRIEHKCTMCEKTIANYLDGDVDDWNAALICKDCFEEYKKEVDSMIEKLTNKSDKINIYI